MARPLLLCYCRGPAVEVVYLLVNADAEHGLLPDEKPRCHPFFDIRPRESDPGFVPSGVRIGTVVVPFSRKEQEHVSLPDFTLLLPGGHELSSAPGDVYQLVFVEDSPLFG